MLNLKPIGIISRVHIEKIFKKIEVKKAEVCSVHIIDYTYCPDSCKYKNCNKYSICTTGCDKCVLKPVNNESIQGIQGQHIIKKEYINNSIIGKDYKKLSKYQILQYLLYHFLPLNGEGRFRYLSEKDISEKLNCSVKTVKRNNEVLKALNLIKYDYDDFGIISLSIVDYQDSFKTKDEKGKGGISVPSSAFDEIVKYQSIDEIRIALFMLQKYISYEGIYGFDSLCNLAINDFINSKLELVSEGKRYRKKIFSITQKLLNLFIINKKEESNSPKVIGFKIKKIFSPNKYKKEYQEKALTKIIDITENKEIKTKEKDLDDLMGLVMQYGENPVIAAINKFKMPLAIGKIKLGAYIRHEIEENYRNLIGLKTDVTGF